MELQKYMFLSPADATGVSHCSQTIFRWRVFHWKMLILWNQNVWRKRNSFVVLYMKNSLKVLLCDTSGLYLCTILFISYRKVRRTVLIYQSQILQLFKPHVDQWAFPDVSKTSFFKYWFTEKGKTKYCFFLSLTKGPSLTPKTTKVWSSSLWVVNATQRHE